MWRNLCSIWGVAVLGILLAIFFAIQNLSINKDWPERITEINHIKYDVAVTDGGVVSIPTETKP